MIRMLLVYAANVNIVLRNICFWYTYIVSYVYHNFSKPTLKVCKLIMMCIPKV